MSDLRMLNQNKVKKEEQIGITSGSQQNSEKAPLLEKVKFSTILKRSEIRE